MGVEYEGVLVEAVGGDITKQHDCEVVVNAANGQLLPGGGVAGAIHRAAGPGLEEECRPLAPIEPGQAVITGGHELPNRWVVHCLGPVYGVDQPGEELLARCYRRALQLADEHGAVKIAFPAISTGAFGYPMEQAARVAVGEIRRSAAGLKSVNTVRFVLFDENARRLHDGVIREMLGDTA